MGIKTCVHYRCRSKYLLSWEICNKHNVITVTVAYKISLASSALSTTFFQFRKLRHKRHNIYETKKYLIYWHYQCFILFCIDGNWGTWGEWSACTIKEGTNKCMRNRMRRCIDPPPSGSGKYCSLDGTSCEEKQRCVNGCGTPVVKRSLQRRKLNQRQFK